MIRPSRKKRLRPDHTKFGVHSFKFALRYGMPIRGFEKLIWCDVLELND
jgi:hypothetical protein